MEATAAVATTAQVNIRHAAHGRTSASTSTIRGPVQTVRDDVARATLPEPTPIPRHLRDLLPTNPRVDAFLKDDPTQRELTPPRTRDELRRRLADIILRRDALEKRHAERQEREAERARMMAEPAKPKAPRKSRVYEAKGGAAWMEEHGGDWREVAMHDLSQLGDLPERESPRLGRPRKTRVAPDLAAVLRTIAIATGDTAALAAYDALEPTTAALPSQAHPQLPVGASSPTTHGGVDSFAGQEAESPAFISPEPPRRPNEAGAGWMAFHGRDWLEEALADLGVSCVGDLRRKDVVKVRGRICEPEQMELPLIPREWARRLSVPEVVELTQPAPRVRVSWREKLAKYDANIGRSAPGQPVLDPFMDIFFPQGAAVPEARAGPAMR